MEVSGVAALSNIGATSNTATTAPVNAPTSTGGALPTDRVEMSPDAMRAMESCSAPVVHDNVSPVATNAKSSSSVTTECHVPYTRTGALVQECNLAPKVEQTTQTEIVQFVEEATETLQDSMVMIFNVKSMIEQYRLILEWLLLLLAMMLLARYI